MGKVWLVSSGSYSDYGIRAAFSTQEGAAAYAGEMNEKAGHSYDGGYSVEEWDLDLPRAELGGCYQADIDRDGNVMDTIEWSTYRKSSEPAETWDGAHWKEKPRTLPHFRGFGIAPEHARRSAEDLRRATITGTVVTEPSQG